MSLDTLYALMLIDLDNGMTRDQVDLGLLLSHLQLASDAELQYLGFAATAAYAGAATAGGATTLILVEVWKTGRNIALKDLARKCFGDRAR